MGYDLILFDVIWNLDIVAVYRQVLKTLLSPGFWIETSNSHELCVFVE